MSDESWDQSDEIKFLRSVKVSNHFDQKKLSLHKDCIYVLQLTQTEVDRLQAYSHISKSNIVKK
jgi:hypothetical protein